MSIVSVHGPHTFGSKAVAQAAPVMAVVDPTNGLKWDFKLVSNTTRSNQDFSWAAGGDGSPATQNLVDPAVVTYSTAGSKPSILTVTNTAKTVLNKALTNNVATVNTTAAHGFIPGQVVTITGAIGAPFLGDWTLITASGTTMTFAVTAADVTQTSVGGTVTSAASQYPPAGTYPLTITAVAGVAPLELMSSPPPDGGGEELPPETFDPADHTVAEVEQYVTDNPDELDMVYVSEIAGKNRVTLVTWLEEFEPQQP